jgi:hypothetical protein
MFAAETACIESVPLAAGSNLMLSGLIAVLGYTIFKGFPTLFDSIGMSRDFDSCHASLL